MKLFSGGLETVHLDLLDNMMPQTFGPTSIFVIFKLFSVFLFGMFGSDTISPSSGPVFPTKHMI